MVTNLFHPFGDDMSPYSHDDFRSSFGSCNAYPFGDLDLPNEDFQPPSCSYFDGYEVVASQEQ
jgi:hypothetical protein